MLTELSIRDIALIPRLHVRFGPGLNVLSGETGAGKSLIVGSLGLLCGEKPPPGFVRAGSERGFVEAIFEVDPQGWIARELADLGLDVEDGELIVRREISASGKGRIRANGQAIPLRTLAAAAECLIDLHGQHAHQSLLRPSVQLSAVDAAGSLFDARDAFGRDLLDWREAVAERDEARRRFVQDRDRRELARLQLRELEEADPRPGERAELLLEHSRLERAEILRETAARLVETLVDAEDSVQDIVAGLADAAQRASGGDPDWAPMAEGLERLAIDASELAGEARRLGDRAVDDPERLEWARERVRTLDDLLRKYGPEESDLFGFLERLRGEEADPEARERRLTALEEQVQTISDRLEARGAELSRKRRTAARRLSKAVEKVLLGLGMEGTRFDASLSPRESGDAFRGEESPVRGGRSGLDSAEFLIAPNRGEEPRPLRSIASGGEISRVMLALKSIVGASRGTATMIFDEIDSGVGGTIAGRVADTLADLAEERQVICITHLAAIASRASVHLAVRKSTEGERTVTTLEPVEGEDRVEEIARMLGGADRAESARTHARELLTKEPK